MPGRTDTALTPHWNSADTALEWLQRAAQTQEQALGIYRDLGDRLGQANTLNGLGAVRREMGDYQGAAQTQEQALGIYRDLGDRRRVRV